jgi:hypothetical protein
MNKGDAMVRELPKHAEKLLSTELLVHATILARCGAKHGGASSGEVFDVMAGLRAIESVKVPSDKEIGVAVYTTLAPLLEAGYVTYDNSNQKWMLTENGESYCGRVVYVEGTENPAALKEVLDRLKLNEREIFQLANKAEGMILQAQLERILKGMLGVREVHRPDYVAETGNRHS